MEKTENLGLIKESEEEFYNVKTINDNLDKIDAEVGNKVDKESGKGLSSNDYTDEEKEKVSQIGDVSGRANDAYEQANTAYNQANSAYNVASNAVNKLDASAVAIGANASATAASGIYSTALGHQANANGLSSTALGSSANAIGNYSTALGSSVNAIGNYSTALGRSANASGSNSTALGYSAKANGVNSTALGYSANANGVNSTALGYSANVSGNNSTALGYGARANGVNSTALGYSASANGLSSTAVGSSARASSYATVVGCNASAINNSTALGYNTNADSSLSTAVGFSAKAIGLNSTAVGSNANANGHCSTALGGFAKAIGDYSTSLGYYATAANTKANTMQLGNASSLSELSCRVALTVTSDERDKADITEIDNGAVEFLKKVKAIRYVFNHRELYIDEESLSEEERRKKEMYGLCEYDREAHAKGTKKGSRVRVGVSAQGTQKALEETYGSSDYANLINDNLFDLNPDDIPEGVENQLTANYEGFIPFLIKAVQELAARLEAVEESSRKGAVTA